MGQTSLKLFDKGDTAMLMFTPVVPAILTKNERHLGRFSNSMSLACWS